MTYGPWRDVQLVGNRNIFDSFDFVSGNILFVVTAFLCCVYVGWVMKKDAIAELSNDGHITTKWLWVWYYYVKFIVPVIIGIIFYFGIL